MDLLVNRISLGGEICRDTRAFCLGTLDDAIQKHELTASQLLQLRGGSGTHHPTGTNHARRASKVTLQSPGRSADALRRENSLTSKRLTAKGLAAASLNFGVGRVDASLHIRVHVSSGFVHPSCPGRGNRDGAHHVEVEGAEPSSRVVEVVVADLRRRRVVTAWGDHFLSSRLAGNAPSVQLRRRELFRVFGALVLDLLLSPPVQDTRQF